MARSTGARVPRGTWRACPPRSDETGQASSLVRANRGFVSSVRCPKRSLLPRDPGTGIRRHARCPAGLRLPDSPAADTTPRQRPPRTRDRGFRQLCQVSEVVSLPRRPLRACRGTLAHVASCAAPRAGGRPRRRGPCRGTSGAASCAGRCAPFANVRNAPGKPRSARGFESPRLHSTRPRCGRRRSGDSLMAGHLLPAAHRSGDESNVLSE